MHKSKNSPFLPHFCFPWARPWRNHAKCCMDRKRIRSMLRNCLAACVHLTITVSEIERDIGENNGRKAGFFHTPLHSTPLLGGFPSEYRHAVWCGKTRMVWLPDSKKNFEDMFIRFDVIHERDGQTDGQTPHDSIDRACIASRGKNHPILMKFCTQPQILNWMNVTWLKMKKLHWTDSEFDRTSFLFFFRFGGSLQLVTAKTAGRILT